jgi:pilus assembly protein CpaC
LAEVNRRAMRQIGADLQGGDDTTTTFLRSMMSGGGNLTAIFSRPDFQMALRAMRRNNVAKILAEPNLVTLSGHVANFQSGGEFAVPVAQQGGGAGNNTVEFKPFGVQLAFVPYVQDDGVIRLHVEPEVSTVDDSLSVTLIAGGEPIPGLRTRNASTTVELRQGQTLAIAGLLNNEIDGQTERVPLLGDLPYVGPLFSSTQHDVIEQELLVAVTPYLVSPINACERPPLPGQGITEPNDLEFYLLNRLEGRTGYPHRSTGKWDNPFRCLDRMRIEQTHAYGPVGLSP